MSDVRLVIIGSRGCLRGAVAVCYRMGLGHGGVLRLTATSFDTTAAWLRTRRWKRLHTFGVYFLWLEFTGAFGRRALHDPFYVPFALVFVAALGVRVAAHRLGVRQIPVPS